MMWDAFVRGFVFVPGVFARILGHEALMTVLGLVSFLLLAAALCHFLAGVLDAATRDRID